ncbi:MAG: hypothetical protein Q9170_005079 [Blastenia crenularia]
MNFAYSKYNTKMSFITRQSESSSIQPKRSNRYSVQVSNPNEERLQILRSGSSYGSERVRRTQSERADFQIDLEREVRRDEYEKRERERERERISARERSVREQERRLIVENERAIQQEAIRLDQERRFRDRIQQEKLDQERHLLDQKLALTEQTERMRREELTERIRRDEFIERVRREELAERIKREQDRTREKELRRREQEHMRDLQKKEQERMERDQERTKLSRKDKRTNSGKNHLEPRPRGANEHSIQPVTVNAPAPEESKSFLSRWPSLFSSSAVAKNEPPPKPELKPAIEAVAKVDKPEPQPKTTQSSSVDLEGYFLQPAEDSQIRNGVIALCDSIDQHVYNHYGNRETAFSNDTLLRLVEINDDDSRLPKTPINQESFRLAAIRRFIAKTIIEDISFDGDASTTFLPREVVSLLSMVPVHSNEKFRFGASSVFRRTAANLLRLSQNGESPEYTEFTRAQVKHASDRLHKRLLVLANRESSEVARRDQLEAIVTKAAQLGVLLLLQPATYRFEWLVKFSAGSSFDDQGKDKSKAGPFLMFPALIRTGDNTGRELRKPQLVCEPEYLDEDDLVENCNVSR